MKRLLRNSGRWWVPVVGAACLTGLLASSGWAQEETAAATYTFEQEMGYTINTLIMFVCAVLVIFMQAGFAMLEVGLNSSKNTVNILFKNIMDLAVGVLLFAFIGYGMMYPGDAYEGSWLPPLYVNGAPESIVRADFRDAQEGAAGAWSAAPTFDGDDPYASNSVDFLFQVAFAATAATIVSGAVAGRMRFEAYLIYSAVITGLVYPLSGFWKWGGGALDAMGFQDFAGSIVVHALGGFAGLAGAIILGPRLGRFINGRSIPIPGHNLAFAALGVFVLWVGWYGFNPGSQLTYSGFINAEATTYIAVTTTLAAAAGTVVAMATAWALFKKPDVTMALNGALAGLVGITANCDQVTLAAALLIGGIAGVLVVAGIVALDKLRIDDPVGAFPVHGLCGLWGGLATGLFGLNLPEFTNAAGEVVNMTRGQYFGVQLFASLVICAWAFGTMLLLFAALKAIGILRVSAEEEHEGLDVSEHGMKAYAADPYVGGSVASRPASESHSVTAGV